MAGRRRKRRSSFFLAGTYFDYPALFMTLFLTMFGLVMVYSASSYIARLSGDEAYYFKRQALVALVGIVFMIVISFVRYQKIRLFALMIAIVSFGLMMLVHFAGTSENGSTRWLYIAGFTFQPSEIVKLAIIIYMAHALTAYSSALDNIIDTAKVFIVPIALIIPIAIENLSTAIICGVIMVGMWFIATPKIRYIVIIGIIGVIGVIIFITKAGYRGNRIEAWLNPETSENGYQTMQSLYAIGSGGLFGRGLGQSIQKMGFIPEAHNDMIFSVVCEELGIIGGIGLVVVFILFLWRLRMIAEGAPDRFGSFLVTGVIIHIGFQVVVNMCVVTNLMPNTGVTLPFVSYGGSSLLFLLIELGIVFSVSRQIRPYKEVHANAVKEV
ncbi:MAG: putative lipid II flippase FtsW [Eubacterium sp.]|nr:putative lipid II flippase FtsW [Eubacterium sp.]